MKKLSIAALIISIVALGVAIFVLTDGLTGAGTFVFNRSVSNTAQQAVTSTPQAVETPSTLREGTIEQPVTQTEATSTTIEVQTNDARRILFKILADYSDGALTGFTISEVSGAGIDSLVQAASTEVLRESTLQQVVATEDLRAFRVQFNDFVEQVVASASSKWPGPLLVKFSPDFLGSQYTEAQAENTADMLYWWILTLDFCDLNPNSLICLPEYDQ